MKGQRSILFLLVVVSGLLALVAVIASAAGSQLDSQVEGNLPGWRQANADGFGDPANQQIPSLAVFGDHLYAGTWYTQGVAATSEIWRTADGTNWQKVGAGFGHGAAHLAAFDSYLYVGTWDGNVWRSPDGVGWTAVISDGFGDSANGIARFAVFSDTLYASTWNSAGTEIWRTQDGTEWIQVLDSGMGDPSSVGAIASDVFEGLLYYGVGNWDRGAELWRTNGITWTAVISGGFGDAENAAVSALAAFDNQLYAGLWNESGVQVWRSPDGTQWNPVVTDGFGDPQTNMECALEVLDGELYLVGRNDTSGLEVWRTADGIHWNQVGFEGFGDSHNAWSYWDNATTVFDGSLYVATNNFATGGEVWQMLRHTVYVPLIVRDYITPRITGSQLEQ
jgi:hypothetical protein